MNKDAEKNLRKKVMDPGWFRAFIQSQNIEPIGVVEKRYYKTRNVDEATRYYNSDQFDKDWTRLALETGKVKQKETERLILNMSPEKVRMMFGPENILEFYEETLKGKKKMASIDRFRVRLACYNAIRDIESKVFQRPWYRGRMSKLSSLALSELFYTDKTAKDAIDFVRNTTKNDPPLADLLRKSKGDIHDFMLKVNEMLKPDKEDTAKDLMIKRIYQAFLRDIMKHKTDTPSEIAETNEEADKLIAEIEKATVPAEHLIQTINKYERKY